MPEIKINIVRPSKALIVAPVTKPVVSEKEDDDYDTQLSKYTFTISYEATESQQESMLEQIEQLECYYEEFISSGWTVEKLDKYIDEDDEED